MPKHARTDEIKVSVLEESSERSGTAKSHIAHNKGTKKKHLTLAQKKSRRMRRVLIVAIVLIALLIGSLGYFTWLLFNEAQTEATQQALNQESPDVDQLKGNETDDSASQVEKQIEAPNLAYLLGSTQDDAITAIGKGATLASTTKVKEKGNPIRKSLKVILTDEPGTDRMGTPTVYLDLNADGKVISAGYSASALALGYGSLSFSEAIEQDKIIENTLAEAGVTIKENEIALPDDKDSYSTYGSDGHTLEKSAYTFSGTTKEGKTVLEWSVVLKYDYSSYNASGNPVDTMRQIYVYVSQEGVTAALLEAESIAQEEQAAAEAAAEEKKAAKAKEEAKAKKKS